MQHQQASSLASQLKKLHRQKNDQEAGEQIREQGHEDFDSAFPTLQSDFSPNIDQSNLPRLKQAGIVTEIMDVVNLKLDKTFSEKLKRIQQKCKTQVDVSTASKTNTTTFLIKGDTEQVQLARRLLVREFASKVSIKMTIPQSQLRFIIGMKGQTLQAIQNRTGAVLELPNKEQATGSDECEIIITSDEQGCQMAQEEIRHILAERSGRQVVRLEQIESKWYPFINGVRGEGVQAIAKEYAVKINLPYPPPPPSSTYSTPSEGAEAITVSGDRENVSRAVHFLENMVRKLNEDTKTLMVSVPKRQHKFLVGSRYSNVYEIFQETGCWVELTPPDDPSEMVTIRGPKDNLIEALSRVMDKTSAIKVANVDLVALHSTARRPHEHASRLLRYLQASNVISQLETEHSVQITVFRERCEIEVVGKSLLDVDRAVTALQTIVFGVEQDMVIIVEIPTDAVGHVIGKKRQNAEKLRERFQVAIVSTTEERGDLTELLLVYEGREKSSVAESLQAARAELEKIAREMGDITVIRNKVASKYHKYVLGPKGAILNELLSTDPAVTVWLGNRQRKDMEADEIMVRGPRESVERVFGEIQRLVEEGKHQEVMSAYALSFTVPRRYLPHLIGKGGGNLMRLKDRLNVRVEVNDVEGEAEMAEVVVQGVKTQADQAKNELLGMVENLLDQTQTTVQVAPEFHSSLIGPQGRYVKKLEDKYGVRIVFPKQPDDAEVVIRGGKRGVDKAKQEIVEYITYETERSYQETFSVPRRYLRHILGSKGSRITQIKQETDTRIDVDAAAASNNEDAESTEENEGNDDSIAEITIKGIKEEVKKAKSAILAIVKQQESNMTLVLKISPEYHKALIGAAGQRIKKIIEEQGDGCIVKFPKNRTSDKVVISGLKTAVHHIRDELLRMVDMEKQKVTLTLKIPKSERPAIIGRNGRNLRDLQKRFQIDVDFISISEINEEELRIHGLAHNCEAALTELRGLIKESSLVAVPKDWHSLLLGSDKQNTTIRFLRAEFGVSVDHPVPTEELLSTLGQPHLSTDEVIMWRLRGEAEETERATEWLQNRLDSLKQGCREIIEVPVELHAMVIGKGGGRIRQLEKETGCMVEMPKTRGDPQIILQGSQEAVEQARQELNLLINRSHKKEE